MSNHDDYRKLSQPYTLITASCLVLISPTLLVLLPLSHNVEAILVCIFTLLLLHEV